MISPEHLGKNLLAANWGAKFLVWLGLIPVIFLLELSLYKAMIKARSLLVKGASPSWTAELYFRMLLIGFASLTAEVLHGPRR